MLAQALPEAKAELARVGALAEVARQVVSERDSAAERERQQALEAQRALGHDLDGDSQHDRGHGRGFSPGW